MQVLVVLALLGIVNGGAQEYWNEQCRQEHGTCDRDEYENLRLVALRSTGCRRFCQCAHASTELDGSVTYYWVAQICPQGTLFDDSLPAPVCNHEHLVKCTGGTQPSGDVCKDEHGTCTKYDYEVIRLVALESSGCHKFCQCAYASTELDGSVTYKWVEKTCPTGTLFDESLPTPVCNHANQVTCGAPGNNNGGGNNNQSNSDGGTGNGNAACRAEHGTCTKYDYEVIRLVALESSGCHKFCQCAYASTELDGSVTYKWVEKTCPTGTLFDESLPVPVCNHANQVTCGAPGNNNGGGNNNSSNSDDDSNNHDDSNLGDETTGNGNAACRAEHGTCNKYEYEIVRLVPLASSGCKNFCQCAYASTELDGSVTYHWVEQSCPAGLLFDQKIRVCNYPDNVKCESTVPGGDGDSCKEEHGSCNSLKYFFTRLVSLRSSGCQDFCQCAYASTEQDGSVTYYWVQHTCPAGTLFNSGIRVCDWPNNVRC